MLIFSPEASSQDSQLVQWIFKNNILILRAHKNSFDGRKEKIVVLEIEYDETWELDLTEVGDPLFIIDRQEIEQRGAKYFVSFGD